MNPLATECGCRTAAGRPSPAAPLPPLASPLLRWRRNCCRAQKFHAPCSQALLAMCQGPHPTAEALSLVGAACMAAGEAQRALHFLGRAQQAAQLLWEPCGAAGGATGVARAAAAAVGPSAGPAVGSAPLLPGSAALLSSMADCHERLGEWSEALASLERIPPPRRCARTWARLGRLHARSAAGRMPAIGAYKVRGQCPVCWRGLPVATL